MRPRSIRQSEAAPAKRATRQRDAIRAAIESARRPLSAPEVLDVTQRVVPSMGMATVYRNLKLLLEEGAIRVVALPGENPRYEIAALGHHHHFRCRVCERVYDIPECTGNIAALAPQGFTVDEHDITLYGRCAACAS